MNTLKNRFRAFLQVLKPMSWKQRMEHIFTYYKFIFVGIFCLLVVISIGVNAIHRSQNPPLYRGALIGMNIADPAKNYLTDDLQDFLDGADSKRAVVLREIGFMDIEDPASAKVNQAAYYQITTLISGQELEYCLMDEHAWGLLKDGYFFADLQTLLPRDDFDRFSPYIQWVKDPETGAFIALGLDISHLPIMEKYTLGDSPVYLAFPGNTESSTFNVQFIAHLCRWDH